MKRKEFFAKALLSGAGLLGLSSLLSINKNYQNLAENENEADCDPSPNETRGPFPNKTPADYVRENIIGDRVGVPLQINLTILSKDKNCQPLANALVDIWHCDSKGKYSEYGNHYLQKEDLTQSHFLRGRQKSDSQGKVSFISIFPGYYPGRAPHIHLEVLDKDENSLLATQIAFPEGTCQKVYESKNYGNDTFLTNENDGIFRDSLAQNMIDSIRGDVVNGFVLEKSIIT